MISIEHEGKTYRYLSDQKNPVWVDEKNIQPTIKVQGALRKLAIDQGINLTPSEKNVKVTRNTSAKKVSNTNPRVVPVDSSRGRSQGKWKVLVDPIS